MKSITFMLNNVINSELSREGLLQANGIKIGPQHSPSNPSLSSGSQGSMQGGGCC